jgi:hypothetical protein
MIIFGGSSGPTGAAHLRDIYAFKPETNTWFMVEVKGSQPIPLCSHASVTLDAQMYVFGGIGQGAQSWFRLAIFNIETREWQQPTVSGSVPPPLRGHSLSLVGSKIYLIGGINPSSVPSSDVFVLDIEKNEWSHVAPTGPVPPHRWGHSATVVGDKIVMFGGSGKNILYDDVWIFDTATNTWSSPVVSGSKPSKRRYHAAELIHNYLVVFGGGDDKNFYNDTHILNLGNFEWIQPNVIGTIPSQRWGHTMSAQTSFSPTEGSKSSLLMFGGQSGQMGVALSDEVYELTIAQENDPKQWTELDVKNWLEKMGCQQYAEAFKQNLVNGELLLTLTESDLTAHLGVTLPLHKRRLTMEIEKLKNAVSTGKVLPMIQAPQMASPNLARSVSPTPTTNNTNAIVTPPIHNAQVTPVIAPVSPVAQQVATPTPNPIPMPVNTVTPLPVTPVVQPIVQPLPVNTTPVVTPAVVNQQLINQAPVVTTPVTVVPTPQPIVAVPTPQPTPTPQPQEQPKAEGEDEEDDEEDEEDNDENKEEGEEEEEDEDDDDGDDE